MFPSRYANPGQRVQVEPCVYAEHVGMLRSVIPRISLSCGESRQMSANFMRRAWPLGRGTAHREIRPRKEKRSRPCGRHCTAGRPATLHPEI